MLAASDIEHLFKASTRNENDAINKVREAVLQECMSSPVFLSDPTYGPAWKKASEDCKAKLQALDPSAVMTATLKGGRGSNYDMSVSYTPSTGSAHVQKVEFKYGANKIDDLPQILSLQARFPLLDVSYDVFFYETYLREYVATDPGITEPVPERNAYLAAVIKVSNAGPFFDMLKEREHIEKDKKAAIVNKSITEFLQANASRIDLATLSIKLLETQKGKVFLLCKNGTFYMDQISESDMIGLTYNGIHKGNTIVIKGEKIMYKILLRWRNHKGILNPAWQIKVKRL